MVKQSQEKHFYRSEIDGLRALAVLAVITNHLREEILPGGYLGVDVFFVISGYVASREQLVNKLEPIVQMLNNTKLIHSNLYVFNPFYSLCLPTDKYCSNFRGNYQLFVDGNHLSDFGARYLWKDFSLFLVTQKVFEKT